MSEAVQTVYMISQDDILRDRIRAREDAIRTEQRLLNELAESKAAIADRDAEIERLKKELSKYKK